MKGRSETAYLSETEGVQMPMDTAVSGSQLHPAHVGLSSTGSQSGSTISGDSCLTTDRSIVGARAGDSLPRSETRGDARTWHVATVPRKPLRDLLEPEWDHAHQWEAFDFAACRGAWAAERGA